VKAAFPDMECIVFPKKDYAGIWNLLQHLRTFRKAVSLRTKTPSVFTVFGCGCWQGAVESDGRSADHFLNAAEACVVFEPVQPAGGARAFELVNKTNQFNLNGKRFSEAEWQSIRPRSGGSAFSVSIRISMGLWEQSP